MARVIVRRRKDGKSQGTRVKVINKKEEEKKTVTKPSKKSGRREYTK